ncbi:30S ribosomal protein S9 [Listeria fleischmannii]
MSLKPLIATICKNNKIIINRRLKERKKYGLKGARRAPQFSKR